MNVYCVLKKGGCYTSEYVERLYNNIKKNTTKLDNFICLTDDKIKFCDTIELKHNWSGWWSKIELFRQDLPHSPAVYFDLDTLIIGNIDELMSIPEEYGNFHVLRGFNQRKSGIKNNENFASGIMCGNFYEHSEVYNKFKGDVEKYKSIKYNDWRTGDQGFIADVLQGKEIGRIQNKLNTDYVVGKRFIKSNKINEQVRVIAWSGEPRLHKLSHNQFDDIVKFW